jgi:hypothetical protein
MADSIKLLLPIFLSSKNYDEMLKKLAAFLFYETWIMTFLLRGIPSVDAAFRSVESFGAIGTALSTIPNHEKLNLGGLAVALLIAGLSYAIQLHDRISDLFGIRRRFDRNYILLPLAVLVGAELSPRQLIALTRSRDNLMRTVFYPYVSSRNETPLVDKHEIERALDAWSWYWLLIEAIPLTLLGALIAAGFASYSLLCLFSMIFTILWLLAWLYYLRLESFSRSEIEAIAANSTARLAIRDAFSAL